MTVSDSMGCRGSSLRRGLSLLEMIISIPLVGIALVAALNTVGATKVSQFKVSIGREGHLLAQDLMSEILQQDYSDAEIARAARDDIFLKGSASYAFGPDILPGRDEVATGDRSLFNDVDDYEGWSASPPQSKGGDKYTLTGWARSVSVIFTSPDDLETVSSVDLGWKRIKVTVTYNNVRAAELVAIKAFGLPWLEACCFDDGSCEDLRAEACPTKGGTAQGADTSCANTECPTGPVALLVVVDNTNPTAQELARQALMESWTYRVALISASASQSEFDTAVADAAVAYISSGTAAAELSTKLKTAAIGVVNENVYLVDDFQLSAGVLFTMIRANIRVLDNAHVITSPFPTGQLSILQTSQSLLLFGAQVAPGVRFLAELSIHNPTLATVNTGDELSDGLPAAGRRVQLPWGLTDFDFNGLNDDGRTIMKRALDWAAGLELVCGDAACDPGEECTCVADCGAPVASEQPDTTCDDGLDNDCDGLIDDADSDCSLEMPFAGAICNNGVCELGEACNSCAVDCPGLRTGPRSNQYCCGNGVAEAAEGDGSICDGNY